MHFGCEVQSVMITSSMIVVLVAVVTAASANSRVIGGHDATIEEYPHQVSLQNKKGHFCGGSIVKAEYILTAAHCMVGKVPFDVGVRVGTNRRMDGGYVHEVKAFQICSAFSLDLFTCDAAVVVLRQPIEFSSAAMPISLIPAKERPHHGEMLISTGWGLTAFYENELPEILQAVRIPTIDNSVCSSVYKNETLTVSEFMFCAGGGLDKGSYKGDSGGPLINERKLLVGIVSWGHVGDSSGYPGVYTDIASPFVRNFIIENTP